MFLFKMFALIMGMVMSLSLASCGDDNDEPNTPEKTAKKVMIEYSVALSPDYYDLWDIQVSHISVGGKEETETITEDWSFSYSLNTGDYVPTHYSLKVVGKPKAVTPTLDPEKIYKLVSECFVQVQQLDANGNVVSSNGMLNPNTHTNSVKGEKLTSVITKDYKICNYSYDITVE